MKTMFKGPARKLFDILLARRSSLIGRGIGLCFATIMIFGATSVAAAETPSADRGHENAATAEQIEAYLVRNGAGAWWSVRECLPPPARKAVPPEAPAADTDAAAEITSGDSAR